MQLNKLSDDEILVELKAKQMPTFGTKQERLDRLKKFHGNYSLSFFKVLKNINRYYTNSSKFSYS